MKRVLLASAALAALVVPLAATADHRPGHRQTGPNPNLTINAQPNPVPFGRMTTISGRLGGTDVASKTIELGENPYPFSGGFKSVGTATTDAEGDYSFQVTPNEHTSYRTRAEVEPPETSAAEIVRVRMRISRSVDDRTPERGQEVTFSGRVSPAHDGMNVFIQRRRPSGAWRTRATAVLVDAGPTAETASAYSAALTINRDGVFRAVVRADADHLGNRSRRIRIDAH